MRNLLKKGMSAAIVLSMAASAAVLIPITANAEENSYTITYSDKEYSWTEDYDSTTQKLTINITSSGKNLPGVGGGNKTTYQTYAAASVLVKNRYEGTPVVRELEITGRVPSQIMQGNTSLTKATISGGWDIGECAFDGCTNLTDVSLSTSVSTLDKYAFRNCSSLDITLPNVTSLSQECLRGVKSVTFETLGDAVTGTNGQLSGVGKVTYPKVTATTTADAAPESGDAKPATGFSLTWLKHETSSSQTGHCEPKVYVESTNGDKVFSLKDKDGSWLTTGSRKTIAVVLRGLNDSTATAQIIDSLVID